MTQTKALNSSDVSVLNAQIETHEQHLRRLTLQLLTLTSEESARERVTLMEPATARGGSKTRSAVR